MSDKLKLTLIHPTTSKEYTIEVTSTMTPARMIGKLVEANHLKEGSWNLTHGTTQLQSETGLGAQNVPNNAVLRIIPATLAGNFCVP